MARWNRCYYLLKILLNCLELAGHYFTRCIHRADSDLYLSSLAGVSCGIGESSRIGWKWAVQQGRSGDMGKIGKMKVSVDTIRIFEQNTSMELLNSSQYDNLRFVARADLSVRKVAFHLVDVINPWPSFYKE